MLLFLCLAAAAAVDWQVPAYQSALTETGLRELLGIDDDQATPLIASVHRLGLANRLRSLAAAHVFATDNNVDLVVRWKAERGCDCEAEDLFENPPWHAYKGNGSALDGLLNMVNETQSSVVLKPSSGRPVLVIRSSGRWRWSLPVTLDATKYSAIILDPRGQFAHHQIDCREFLHRKRAFYQRVDDAAMRVAGLNDTLANLRNALANKFVVGLHVRTYDPSSSFELLEDGGGLCPSHLIPQSTVPSSWIRGASSPTIKLIAESSYTEKGPSTSASMAQRCELLD